MRGGLTELRKIATVADTWGMTMAPHRPRINVHLLASIPNGAWAENMGLLDDVWVHPPAYEAGNIIAPERPGHGLAFKPEVLRDFVLKKLTARQGGGGTAPAPPLQGSALTLLILDGLAGPLMSLPVPAVVWQAPRASRLRDMVRLRIMMRSPWWRCCGSGRWIKGIPSQQDDDEQGAPPAIATPRPARRKPKISGAHILALAYPVQANAAIAASTPPGVCGSRRPSSPVPPWQRAKDHRLVQVAEMADAEDLARRAAESAAERDVEARSATRRTCVAVDASGISTAVTLSE